MTSTDIVKWRKTNDYENFEKGMIMKILNKKGGGGNEIHAPWRLWFLLPFDDAYTNITTNHHTIFTPFLCYPTFFHNFHNHSFFLFDNISRRHTL